MSAIPRCRDAIVASACDRDHWQTFVMTMLDAGVDLRDVQIAARHADPRTTMRYDNSRELHQMGEPNTSFRELAA